MKYLSTKEISIKWNIDQSLVLRLLKEGRINGAVRIGKRWAVPEDSLKPIDKRTKVARRKKDVSLFRFPLYINFKEDSYSPLLTSEERKLRSAQLDFNSGNFIDAKNKLEYLLDNCKNKYINITCLYHLCVIYKLENSEKFNLTLLRFNTALCDEFPYKKEMMLLKYYFDMDNTYYKSLLDDFYVDPSYTYHSSCYYILSILCLIPIENGDFSIMSKIRFDTYELLCQQMERDEYYFEAQKLHFLLLVVYHLQNNQERMLFHCMRGVELASKYELYFNAGYYHRLYPEVVSEVLKQYPNEFKDKIISIGNKIRKSEEKFALNSDVPSYLAILSEKDYQFAFLANQGYSNKDIASKLKISEKLVSKKYSEIYDKLNIKSKQELIELINNTHRSGKVN